MNSRLPIAALALLLASCNASDPFVEARPGIEVSPEQLVAAYDKNEVQAQAQYGGRLLLVASQVKAANLNAADKPFLNLAWEGSLLPVQLHFAPGYEGDAKSIEVGKRYTFECLEISEMMGTPMLGQCRTMR